MLYAFVGGLALLFSMALIANWALNTPPRNLVRAAQWVVFGLATLVFLFLLFTGRLAWALAAMAAMVPGAVRLVRLLILGKFLHAAYRGMRNPFAGLGGSGGGRASTGQTTEVSSAFLRMRLDLDSGQMTGVVTAGTFAGRDLDRLSRYEALRLRAELASDQDSLRLFDAWLGRSHPDWQEASESAAPPPGNSNGPMSADEARRILDLGPEATVSDVKEAYRRLMGRLHPDHGGSAYLAAKLNEARDMLLHLMGGDK